MTERNYSIHPLYIIITLVLSSITALFLGFIAAYLYNRFQGNLMPIEVPTLFFTNSILLLATSYLFIRTRKSYEEDRTSDYKKTLWLILILSLLFLALQIYAWKQMIGLNIHLKSSVMSSYLYIISGIHFMHLIGGLPFLIFFIRDAHQRLVEPASVLLYLSDSDKKRKLQVLTIYWHFLDILWIFLVLFFYINTLF